MLLVHRGEFEIFCSHNGEEIKATLKNGDIFTFPKGAKRSITAKTYGLAYFVVGTDYPNNPKIL